MTSKTFEIRDRGTFIPVLAVRLDPATAADRYLIARAGFGTSPDSQGEYVMLTKLSDMQEAHTDPYEWGWPEMTQAHLHIRENFNLLESGAVIDLEFLRGEAACPKLSEAVQ